MIVYLWHLNYLSMNWAGSKTTGSSSTSDGSPLNLPLQIVCSFSLFMVSSRSSKEVMYLCTVMLCYVMLCCEVIYITTCILYPFQFTLLAMRTPKVWTFLKFQFELSALCLRARSTFTNLLCNSYISIGNIRNLGMMIIRKY